MANVITPSCINECMSCKMSVAPEPGMLGTMFVGTDRYTVVCKSVSSPKRCTVIEMFPDEYLNNRYTNIDGVEYIPEADLDALIDLKTPKLDNFIQVYGKDNGKEMYEFEVKHHSGIIDYTLRKNGRWMPKGSKAWDTCSIHWGYGDYYRDPSF